MRLPSPPDSATEEAGPLRIAVVGRPNVGKSSLVNAIAGQDRVVVHAEPGTTRDAVDTLVTVEGRPYILVDTAGLRRKGRTEGALDKLSAVMARRSLERADLALVVIDAARAGDHAGRADRRVRRGGGPRRRPRGQQVGPGRGRGPRPRAGPLARASGLPFLAHAPIVFTSARAGTGIRELFETIDRVALDYAKEISTGELNRALTAAVERRPPAGCAREDAQDLLRHADRDAAAHVPPVRQRSRRAPLLLRALPGERAARAVRAGRLPRCGSGSAGGVPTRTRLET